MFTSWSEKLCHFAIAHFTMGPRFSQKVRYRYFSLFRWIPPINLIGFYPKFQKFNVAVPKKFLSLVFRNSKKFLFFKLYMKTLFPYFLEHTTTKHHPSPPILPKHDPHHPVTSIHPHPHTTRPIKHFSHICRTPPKHLSKAASRIVASRIQSP